MCLFMFIGNLIETRRNVLDDEVLPLRVNNYLTAAQSRHRAEVQMEGKCYLNDFGVKVIDRCYAKHRKRHRDVTGD